MARDTTVQFRMDSDIKDAAFSVFREMGITPSEAVRVFFKQVQKTRTLPFPVVADEFESEAPEPGYHEWLKARLADVVKRIDSGEMPMHSTEEMRRLVRERVNARRAAKTVTTKPASRP